MVDPVLKRFGRLFIASNYVSPTIAPVVNGGLIASLPVLCAGHMKGECTEGEACMHLHVDPLYIRTLRDTLLSLQTANCCLGHGHLPSRRRDFQSLITTSTVMVVKETGQEVVVAPKHIAVTAFWDQFLTKKAGTPNGTLRFSIARVCRLHQRNSCKFGPDCNNLHLCREFWSGGKAVPGPSQKKLQEPGTPPATPESPQHFSPPASPAPSLSSSPMNLRLSPGYDARKGPSDVPFSPVFPSALGFQPFVTPVAPRAMSLPAAQPPLMHQPSLRPHSLSISFPYQFQLFPQPITTSATCIAATTPKWPPSPLVASIAPAWPLSPPARPSPAMAPAVQPPAPVPIASQDTTGSPHGRNLAKIRGQLTVLQLSVPNHAPAPPQDIEITTPVEPLSKEEYLRVLQHWGPFDSSPPTPHTASAPTSPGTTEKDGGLSSGVLQALEILRRHSAPSVA